ncbi:TetR/AcrR family transcriptional regulator [Mycolicibacterium farcinogenes]|uniref:TetR/AcrR family transcriptional regulator n=1 Tax=Mycolicibacterium farcinogenes TaxID=1802 RepID=UPI00289C3D5D|nr:TetR family transcriptional regulator [Mycolicibacterium farcinogenes]
MSGAAQNRQGAATRLRLVKAAERLFAAQGVDAVSVRAVNAAAGLGAASVHYHFGSKDDLLSAVLTDIGTPVRDEIAANVALLAADPVAPSADALVRAVTEPYLKLLLRYRVRGMRWIKIIAQISQENHPVLLETEQHLPERTLRAGATGLSGFGPGPPRTALGHLDHELHPGVEPRRRMAPQRQQA